MSYTILDTRDKEVLQKEINANKENLGKLSEEIGDLSKLSNYGNNVVDILLKLISGGNITPDEEEVLKSAIPVVRINGDLSGISEENYVNVICDYTDESNNVTFTDYAEFAWQGSGSLSYSKKVSGIDVAKNFKIKLYSDEDRTEKSKRVFEDWHATNNYHLKCNYADATNIMNNLMMHYITKSYQYLTPLPREGARYTVDGFPVLLYVNDVFTGIRFWNLKQDDKVYNLNEEILDESSGAIIQEADLCYQIGRNNGTNEGTNSGAFIYGNLSSYGNTFTDAHAEIDYYWEDRVWDKTENHPSVLYDTIQWVSEATNEEFKANLANYFDVDYLINYFVIMYTCGMIDSKGKNFNMLYFPDKGKWYPTFWDMDNAFGTNYSVGKTNYNVELSNYGCPNSRLFDKLWSNFHDECVDKYLELRQTLFTVEQVEDSIDKTLFGVSNEWLAENFKVKYDGTSYSPITEPKTYILDWASKRFAYMDKIMVKKDNNEIDESLYISNGRFATLEKTDGLIIEQSSGNIKESSSATLFNEYIFLDGKEYVTLFGFKSFQEPIFMYAYDSNKNYLGSFHTSSGFTFGNTIKMRTILLQIDTKDAITHEIIKLPNNTAYIRVCYSNKSIYNYEWQHKVGITNDNITVKELDSTKIIENVYINDSNEQISANGNYMYDEYLDVNDETLYITWDFSSYGASIRYVEYDENKEFISRGYINNMNWDDLLANINESTKYIKIGTGSDTNKTTFDSIRILNYTQDCVNAILGTT